MVELSTNKCAALVWLSAAVVISISVDAAELFLKFSKNDAGHRRAAIMQ